MDQKSIWNASVMGLAVGLGILVAGLSLSQALYKARAADRYVTVKGLAEREMPANLAFWPVTFKVAADDLGVLQKAIDNKRKTIVSFLVNLGFQEAEISHASPKIVDTKAEQHYGEKRVNAFRYIAQTTVTLRSENVKLVKASMEKSGDLVRKGIVLADTWEGRSEFLFTDLNKIKPEMIEEATVNARQAAEQFAKDSGSQVGKIRTASQGFFSIADRDRNSPDFKKIRVVTTVQYYLVDR